MEFAEALKRFSQIPYLQLGVGSRADWVANILLFVPLAFLWLGVTWSGNAALRLMSSLVVFACAVALSVAIEFTQIFFPPRTVSINDIVAETFGACIGLALWWVWGDRLAAWVSEWRTTRGSIALSGKLLYLYLFGLLMYNVLPLDLTISPVEIYHKWNEGKVVLIPFMFPQLSPAQIIYEIAADIAVWIPVAYLWRSAKQGRSPAQTWRWVVCTATLLEFLQLFVYSRVSDVTDIIAAMIGAVIGNMFVARSPQVTPSTQRQLQPTRRVRSSWVGLWLILMIAWLGLIALVFWYPFDVRLERAFIAERLQFLNRVPFEIYYYGTEFRAVTELLHKILFFAPGGVLLAYGVSRVRSPLWRGIAGFLSILFITGIAFTVELGQVLLPGKYPDLTDWVIETAGGILGYLAWRFLSSRQEKEYRHGAR
jgi:VanZ family protein